MLIGTRHKINHCKVTVHVSGQVLSQVPFTKYLGVFIGQYLTWEKHSEYILQRIKGKVHCLYRSRPLSDSILFQLYYGFIFPIFDYCDTVLALFL